MRTIRFGCRRFSFSSSRFFHITGRKILLLLLILSFLVAWIFKSSLFPAVLSLALSKTESQITELLWNTVFAYFEDNENADGFVNIRYKDDGSVSSLTANTPLCNKFCAFVVSDLVDTLPESRCISVEIPVGNLTQLALLSGKGPLCKINLQVSESVSASLQSSFTETGINQTLHTVTLVVKVPLVCILPAEKHVFSIENSVTVCETVIVGAVPDAYTKIHRLTDDITETEIDDIYDFGAAAP